MTKKYEEIYELKLRCLRIGSIGLSLEKVASQFS